MILALSLLACMDQAVTANPIPNAAPKVAFSSPSADMSVAAEAPVTVVLKLDDDQLLEELEVHLSTDTGFSMSTFEWVGESSVAFVLPSGLDEGLHLLTATVIDPYTETGTAELELLSVPNAAPEVAFTWPEEGSAFEAGEALTLVADVQDDFDMNEDLLFLLEASGDGMLQPHVEVEERRVTLSLPEGLSEADQVLTLSAFDSGALQGSAELGLLADVNQPPTVSISAPNNGDRSYETDYLWIEALVDDDEADLSGHTLTWTGLAETNTCADCGFPGNPAHDGSIGFYANLACRYQNTTVTYSLGLQVTDPEGATATTEILVDLYCSNY